MLEKDIFANIKGDEDMDAILSAGMNFESPFGVNSKVSGQMSAQQASHQYMKTKQRRPFVIEYYKSFKDKNPSSITMYINPERLIVNNTKIIGKQITRGGIFYHHYGADHSTMSLTGTTGLAGMAGIKQLEEIYYASGTLLKYQNYAPVQIYGSVDSFDTIDYNDSLGSIDKVRSGTYSNEMIGDIQNSLWNANKDLVDTTFVKECIGALDIVKSNQDLSKFTNSSLPSILQEVENWENSNPEVDYRQYYQKLLSLISKSVPNYSDKIVVDIAYELSLDKLYKDLPQLEKTESIQNVKKDTLIRTIDFEKRKEEALQKHIDSLNKFYSREKKIRDHLRSGLINMKDDMTDPWLPRQMILYFENRAYVGHFDSFQYQRDSKTNLITYEMRYTITKQYEFNNTNDGYKDETGSGSSDGKEEEKVPVVTTPKPEPAPKPEPPKNDYYTVKSGDTLWAIAKKFYGDPYYWMDIYAANISIIKNPDLIYPGMKLKIPAYSKKTRYWVVSKGDTLWAIAKRFYGSGDKYTKIVQSNPSIKNPDLIYPRQVFKIVL